MRVKAFIISALVGFSVQLWACPDLTGTYVCGGEDVAVETFELDGVNYLEFNGNSLPADGQWLSIPDSETERNAKIRLSCGNSQDYGDHYLLDYEADLYDQGQKFAFLDAEVYIHKTGEDLTQTTTGSAKGTWGEQPLHEVMVCTKK